MTYFVKEDPIESDRRIQALLAYKFMAEAFLAASFSIEKTLFRTFRQLAISAGFSSNQADQLLKNIQGLEKIKKNWHCFDPHHARLDSILDKEVRKTISEAQAMRNKVVHGIEHYSEMQYHQMTDALLSCEKTIRECFQKRYQYDGWTRMRGRKKSKLHTDPYVKVT